MCQIPKCTAPCSYKGPAEDVCLSPVSWKSSSSNLEARHPVLGSRWGIGSLEDVSEQLLMWSQQAHREGQWVKSLRVVAVLPWGSTGTWGHVPDILTFPIPDSWSYFLARCQVKQSGKISLPSELIQPIYTTRTEYPDLLYNHREIIYSSKPNHLVVSALFISQGCCNNQVK